MTPTRDRPLITGKRGGGGNGRMPNTVSKENMRESVLRENNLLSVLRENNLLQHLVN